MIQAAAVATKTPKTNKTPAHDKPNNKAKRGSHKVQNSSQSVRTTGTKRREMKAVRQPSEATVILSHRIGSTGQKQVILLLFGSKSTNVHKPVTPSGCTRAHALLSAGEVIGAALCCKSQDSED